MFISLKVCSVALCSSYLQCEVCALNIETLLQETQLKPRNFHFPWKWESFALAQMASIWEQTNWPKSIEQLDRCPTFFLELCQRKKKTKHENLLPFVPTAENISRPLMWRARALGHRANNLTAVNAAFWHLCIWLRAADNTRLATTQVNVFYRSCSTVGRNWQLRNHRREKIRNGNCASACDHQISFKSEIWFIRFQHSD